MHTSRNLNNTVNGSHNIRPCFAICPIFGPLCGNQLKQSDSTYFLFIVPLAVQCVKMSWAFSFAIFLSGLVMLSWIEVDAKPTVDDSGSCESSTLDEAVNIIREDLKDVKNLCGSKQQHSSAVDTSSLCE